MSDELEKDDLDLDADEADDSESDTSAPPKAEPSADNSEKRTNDLMSKWQAEQAKSAKLEKELASLKSAKQPAPKGSATSDGNPDADEFLKFTRESARKQLYDGDPRLGEYGVDLDAITGSTLAEMKKSFKSQVALVDTIETKARNRVLSEHGLSPEVEAGQGAEGLPSFSSMSDKEFAEFLTARDARRR